MPHSRAFAVLSAALEDLGYHEDGETNGVYLFTTYRNVHWVLLEDSENLTIEEQIAALLRQGIEMSDLYSAIARLSENPDGS
ncbi:MAG: hypothetical protein OXH41_10150 [Chloroflexi bacterium]|nr:hypothetical protein [Chloroflexota bacterium]